MTSIPFGLLAGSGGVRLHPLLWLDLAIRYPWLLVVTNGVRLVTTVLALAMLMLWTPSMVRWLADEHSEALAASAGRLPFGSVLAELLHPPREGDGRRAGYLPLAIAVLIFQARWFFDGLTELTRARMALAGQVAVLCAMAFAIYAHGRKHRELTLGRALAGYAVMLVAGVSAAAVMQ